MDFSLNQEQEILRKTIRSFAERELAPKASEIEDKGEFPRDIIEKMANLGLIGIVIPEKYGGSPMGHLARVIAIEEISRVHPSMGLFLQATPMGLWTILRFGSDEQKLRYIPPVVKGEEIMCMAVTEPTGGSDPTAIRTVAKGDGNEYVINGSKCFVTNGGVADSCVFIAKTGHKSGSLSVFVVEKGTPGFKCGTREKHMGFQSMEITELFFKDCRIPKENLIGREGDGLKAALASISEIGRIGNAGVALGIAEAAYETALQFAMERQLYGNPIFQLQTIQFMLADMDVEIEAARWLAYYAAWLLDHGKAGREIAKEIARAKLYTAEVARKTAVNAVQIHGAYGTLPEFKAIRYLLDSLETIAAGGTSEIMRIIIARNSQ
ncbi:MAG: acyl-CoA dehydrogenase family protein [Candidatus Bathyarchaeota archaeon]|nr:acyl-CoA dehydrogenase family protein [Candidatus Bathyarchaeota archaeon]